MRLRLALTYPRTAALVVTLSVVALAAGAGRAVAAPGDLDTTFGTGGVVLNQFGATTPPTPTTSYGEDVVATPDGHLYVAGVATDVVGHSEAFVARYLSSGVLDSSFGSGGVALEQLGTATTPTTGQTGTGLLRMAVTPDGRVVLATDCNYTDPSNHTYSEVAVMRLTSSGQLDLTFASGGVLRQQLSSDTSSPASTASGVAVQPDGKIVITGQERDVSGSDFFFAERLLASDGSPDPSFGSGGLFESPLGSGSPSSAEGVDVLVQPDGKLVFGAKANDSAGHTEMAITRLTASGTTDPTFGVSYVQASPNPSYGSVPFRVRMQSNGDLVIAGYAYDTLGQWEYALARFTPTGQLDPSFGPSGNGLFLRQLSSIGNSGIYGLAVQGNDRLVAIGGFITGTSNQAATGIIRLMPNGTLDSSFGNGGVQQEQLSTGASPQTIAIGGTLTPDGQLVQTGIVNTPAGGEIKTYLARVQLDSPPTVSFSYAPGSPTPGQAVAFTASASDDTSVTSVGWDLGSGNFSDAAGTTATKTFSSPGNHTIRVRATDDDGLSTISSQTVTVKQAPPSKLVLGALIPTASGVRFTVTCAGGTTCNGRARLSTLERLLGSRTVAVSARSKKRHSKRVQVASRSFSVAAGKQQTLTMQLNSTGKKLLTRFGRLPVTVTISLLNTAPPTVTTTHATIKPKKPKRHTRGAR